MAILCSAETFVLNQSLVLRNNICDENCNLSKQQNVIGNHRQTTVKQEIKETERIIIKCNYYTNGIENQPGDQPIRVFYKLIESDFLSIKESLNQLQPNQNIRKVKLDFITESLKVIGPSTNGLKITLHDTFLSFLWAYIYSIIVIAPIGGKEASIEENHEARELRKYAHGLMKEFSEWDKEAMPNPEVFGKDENRLIGVTNAVFILSVRFILLHEFAHIFLGHPFVPAIQRTPENIKKMEIDADNVAIEWALQTLENEDDFSGKLSLITALNSLSFSPNKFSNSDSHPSPEDRIEVYLQRLTLADDNFLWGYAMWSIMEWQTNHELFHLPSSYKIGDSFKKHFYNMLFELKEYKRTGISKFNE